MALFLVKARSDDGLSGEDYEINANSAEQAEAYYKVAYGSTSLPVVSVEATDPS